MRRVLLYCLFFCALCMACTREKREKSAESDAFVEYIAAHTAGVISVQDEVRIKLTKAVKDSAELGRSIQSGLKFRPAVNGKAFWADASTVVFKPESSFAPNQTYEVSVDLRQLLGAPSSVPAFRFGFKTMEQNFEVNVEGLEIYEKGDNQLQLRGNLQTADVASEELTEKVLRAEQDGKSLKIDWSHEAKNVHRFTVPGIKRKSREDKLLLTWNGKPLGVARKGEKKVSVPAIGEYKVLSVKLVRDGKSYVSVRFSDPVDKRQKIEGLVQVKGMRSPSFVTDGHELKIYPQEDQTGAAELIVHKGLRSRNGDRLQETFKTKVMFTQHKPEVAWESGKGNILPSSHGLVLPFRAVNLRAVNVRVIKIFEDNVLQYLQSNSMGGTGQLRRVGRTVLKTEVPLNDSGVTDLSEWNRFTLDLEKIMKADPGALYQIKIGFDKSQSIYNCGYDTEEEDKVEILEDEQEYETESSYWDGYEPYYSNDFNWRDRDNPCTDSYYGGYRTIQKVLFASDMGIIAKQADKGDLNVFVTDMISTAPMAQTELLIYDFQQQLIAKAKTDAEGKAAVPLDRRAFFLVGKKDKQYGYLKLDDGSSLSLSNFDVSGSVVQKGLKGFIYGERGVWRPGDPMYLSFILEDRGHRLPEDHPVIFELYDPMGRRTDRQVKTSQEGEIYSFVTATDEEAPTGKWTAKVKVGGAVFTQPVKVETVKPNRLKLDLEFPEKALYASDKQFSASLSVRWLHGAVGKNLKAEYDLLLAPAKTTFKGFGQYHFDDASKRFYAERERVFSGRLNAQGKAKFNVSINTERESPGALKAIFKGKAYEPGGEFSIGTKSILYYPYASFVGLKLPEGDSRGMLLTDKKHTVRLVSLTDKGKPDAGQKIKVKIYKLSWRWWWNQSGDDLANYVGRSYRSAVWEGEAATDSKGKAMVDFQINSPEWGRYYVQATNVSSGHSAGQVVYLDWPGWAKKGKQQFGATMLDFTTDKEEYQVGEQVKLTLPASAEGRALISLETGSRLIRSFWVETQKGTAEVAFEATKEMCPNVFINVTLLQPHSQTANDLPIRLYGISGIKVDDPQTRLEPQVKLPESLRPEEKVTVEVSEKNGKPMYYTLAVVDEGLLGLTNYRTPNPWNVFYAKEALGVKTWDLYDQVIGAYGSRLERLLAVGGDGENEGEDKRRARRFKPVVKFMGPFFLKAGENAAHSYQMPQYVGEVRTMVVAVRDGAYGATEVSTPVKQALMVQATLPRVLGPSEKVALPVNVFAMSDRVREVKLNLAVEGDIAVEGSHTQTMQFKKEGDQVAFFRLKTPRKIGRAKVKVSAVSGSVRANYDIEIDVRASNPVFTTVQDTLLAAGQKWSADYKPSGVEGTNRLWLEVSALPPINLSKRLNYLIQYPHGCVEQTASSVFPQLFLKNIMELDEKQTAKISDNVSAGINRLRNFQTEEGAFTYWPGGKYISAWGSSYAGHFLTVAKTRGYFVPERLYDQWLAYEKRTANNWTRTRYYRSDLEQAYRLYVLALAKSPAAGAMNRLKEAGDLSEQAQWRLALAYAVMGQQSVAGQMIKGLSDTVKDYRELSGTFGSAVRDEAMILECLTYMGQKERAFALLKNVARRLSSDQWMSTQTTAYCLLAVAEYIGKARPEGEHTYTYTDRQSPNKVTFETMMSRDELTAAPQKIQLENTSSAPLYFRLIQEGIPLEGADADNSKNLRLQIVYKDQDGKVMDVSKLKQGTDFTAEVTVSNPGIRGEYKEMALEQLFPSGWEILNSRLDDTEKFTKQDAFDSQDIRDDRVYTYFSLKPNKRKTFIVHLNASYQGRFYLPALKCAAMYDHEIYAYRKGQWVEVIPEK